MGYGENGGLAVWNSKVGDSRKRGLIRLKTERGGGGGGGGLSRKERLEESEKRRE